MLLFFFLPSSGGGDDDADDCGFVLFFFYCINKSIQRHKITIKHIIVTRSSDLFTSKYFS